MTTFLRPSSLRARLLLQILPAVALAVIALTAVAVKVASDSQRDAVYGQMSQLIGREAASFDGDGAARQAIAHDSGPRVEADSTMTAPAAPRSSSSSRVATPTCSALGRLRAERVTAATPTTSAAACSATTRAASPSGPSA